MPTNTHPSSLAERAGGHAFLYEPSYPPSIPASMTIAGYRRSRVRPGRIRRIGRWWS
jgi:hypothetical protein